MTLGPRGQNERTGVIAALLRVARGDRTGIAGFGATTQAFLTSLMPLIALPLVVSLATLAGGEVVKATVDLLASVSALLLPPVISHALARHWHREAQWLRFAVAFNWCQFALSLLLLLLLGALGVVFGPAVNGGSQSDAAMGFVVLLCLGLVGYGLWLHWFIAREGLAISGWRAVLVVAAVYLGTMLVLVGRGLWFMEHG